MSKCKLCGAPQRREIEALVIGEGMGYEAIAERAAGLGLEISHMAIKRHVDSGHIPGYRRGAGAADAPGLSGDEVETMQDGPLNIEMPDIQDGAALQEYAGNALRRIVANQLAIIEAKQRRYMRGEARYPQAEINGLRSIIATMDMLTSGRGGALDTDKIGKPNAERLEALEDAYWGERALAAEKNGEFVDGVAALEALAKQKGV